MAQLIIMLVLNACSAMFLVPAWVNIFKPKFIMKAGEERWSEKEHLHVVEKAT